MAATLQTLILTPPSPQALSFGLVNPRFPPNHAFFYSTSITFNHSRSIYRPIRALERSDQRDGNGDKVNRVSGSASGLNWAKPLLNFVANNFLPVALVSGVALGLANPSLGCLADRYSLSKFSTFGIFIIAGLTLHSGDIGAAAEAWPVGVFGLVSILMISPYFSRAILQMQMKPQEFVTGLAIFSCMPTTLSSGVALTQLAGGNSALALAMTVISNMLGILIVPFSISKFIADGVGVSVPTKQLFRSLVLTLLVPLVLGKVFRESFNGLADFVDQNRKLFSKFSALFLSLDSWKTGGIALVPNFLANTLVPWIQVSRSRSLLLMAKPTVFLIAIGMGALLHVFLLAFNALAIQSLSAVTGGSKSNFSKKENASALVLVTSQKTLPVMVAVVEQLGGAFGESGLLVLPCVAAHLNQIIMDSLLVNLWLRKDPVPYNAKAN